MYSMTYIRRCSERNRINEENECLCILWNRRIRKKEINDHLRFSLSGVTAKTSGDTTPNSASKYLFPNRISAKIIQIIQDTSDNAKP